MDKYYYCMVYKYHLLRLFHLSYKSQHHKKCFLIRLLCMLNILCNCFCHLRIFVYILYSLYLLYKQFSPNLCMYLLDISHMFHLIKLSHQFYIHLNDIFGFNSKHECNQDMVNIISHLVRSVLYLNIQELFKRMFFNQVMDMYHPSIGHKCHPLLKSHLKHMNLRYIKYDYSSL